VGVKKGDISPLFKIKLNKKKKKLVV